MPILNHEHQISPVEGKLLSPSEKAELKLDPNKHYYINGRCNLPGCEFFTYGEIFVNLKIRSPKIVVRKKS